MELFIIYLITRLNEVKATLSAMFVWLLIALIVTVIARVVAELCTEAEHKYPATPDEGSMAFDVYAYRRVRQITKRGFFIFVPMFLFVTVTNLFLPSSRDAVLIAGGYGLVEAVKNERVQRLFNKSASVTGQWLDAQLNEELAEKPKKSDNAKSNKKSKDVAEEDDEAEPVDTRKKKAVPPGDATNDDTASVKDKVVARVTERVADELLGPSKK